MRRTRRIGDQAEFPRATAFETFLFEIRVCVVGCESGARGVFARAAFHCNGARASRPILLGLQQHRFRQLACPDLPEAAQRWSGLCCCVDTVGVPVGHGARDTRDGDLESAARPQRTDTFCAILCCV